MDKKEIALLQLIKDGGYEDGEAMMKDALFGPYNMDGICLDCHYMEHTEPDTWLAKCPGCDVKEFCGAEELYMFVGGTPDVPSDDPQMYAPKTNGSLTPKMDQISRSTCQFCGNKADGLTGLPADTCMECYRKYYGKNVRTGEMEQILVPASS